MGKLSETYSENRENLDGDLPDFALNNHNFP